MEEQTPTSATADRETTPLQTVRTPSQRCPKKTMMMKDLKKTMTNNPQSRF